MMDIKWTITVHVPQLDTINQTLRDIGEKLVETVASIITTIERLNTNQTAEAQALNAQVTRIADEVAQWNAESITQQQIDNLGAALKTAADNAAKHAADIQANTEAIRGIVPDAPAAGA
jgi:NAD-dependent DNA ligase